MKMNKYHVGLMSVSAAIGITIIGVVLVSKKFISKESCDRRIELQYEYVHLDHYYTNFLDSCFRLRSEKATESDINDLCADLLSIWVHDRKAAQKILTKNYDFSADTKKIFAGKLSMNDLLDIKRFGIIEVDEDANFVAFFSTNDKGQRIRLRLLYKSKNSPAINRDYHEMNQEFASDARGFIEQLNK